MLSHLDLEADIASEYDNVRVIGIDELTHHHRLLFITPMHDEYKIWYSGTVKDRPWRTGRVVDCDPDNSPGNIENLAGHATMRMAIEWLKHLD
jgi:hypothetical protein